MTHRKQFGTGDLRLAYLNDGAVGHDRQPRSGPDGLRSPITRLLQRLGIVGSQASPARSAAGPDPRPNPNGHITARELIGARAIRHGFLTTDQVEQALLVQRTQAAQGGRLRLGALLRQSGALSAPQLAQLLAEHAAGYRVSADAARVASILQQPIAEGVHSILFAGVRQRHASDIVATSVGVALALMEQRTVAIVDCDFHRPTLHRLFTIDQSPGTLSVMCGKIGIEDALCDTGLPGLAVLATEQSRDLPGREFLDDVGTARILSVKASRRIVILVAPPVLDSAETLILAPRVDATLLVSEAHVGRATELAEAERLLQAVGAKPLGVILSRQGA